MNEPGTFVASYATRRQAGSAVEALRAGGRRAAAPQSPNENGEWPVCLPGPFRREAVERCCRFLRARHRQIGAPVSW